MPETTQEKLEGENASETEDENVWTFVWEIEFSCICGAEDFTTFRFSISTYTVLSTEMQPVIRCSPALPLANKTATKTTVNRDSEKSPNLGLFNLGFNLKY